MQLSRLIYVALKGGRGDYYESLQARSEVRTDFRKPFIFNILPENIVDEPDFVELMAVGDLNLWE